MYKRILVPLDGSELAEKALDHAKALVKAGGTAQIDLVFVVQPLSADVHSAVSDKDRDYLAQSDKKESDWGNSYLEKVTQNLKKDGIKAESNVLIGSPAEKILDFVTKNSIDLIVMSTHGRSGMARWAFGSVAQKILVSSTCPVLLARPTG